MAKHSSNVQIETANYDSLDILCGNAASKQIVYDTDNLLQSDILLMTTKAEDELWLLPCDDIEILCENEFAEDAECQYEYKLMDEVNQDIINSSFDGCYWIDMSRVYKPFCVGSCGLDTQIYTHHIDLHLELTITDNDTYIHHGIKFELDEYAICDKYLGDINVTRRTMDDLDVIFTLSLNDYIEETEVYDVTDNPRLFLKDNLYEIDCMRFNISTDVVPIQAKFSVRSKTENGKDIDALFAASSTFYIEVNRLMKSYFGDIFRISVVEPLPIPSLKSILGKPWFIIMIVLLITAFTVCMLLSVYWYKKHQKVTLERENKTIRVKRAMVISIAIGEYDDNDLYQDLPLEHDLNYVKKLFVEGLNYELFPKEIQLRWTQKELFQFLIKMAREFNANCHVYDGLVVVISCHGIQNMIICSDSKAIERVAIHRIFSHHYPKVRKKVRLFMFDCCDGAMSRNTSGRTSQYSGDVTKLSPNKSVIIGTNAHGNVIGKQASFRDLDTNNVYVENDSLRKYISGRVIGLDYIDSLNKTYTAAWNSDEDNPDYRLITVVASNFGFEAKMSKTRGSYLIRKFTEAINYNIFIANNELFLSDILDNVQKGLTDKQLTNHTCNNETGFVKFYPFKRDKKDIKTDFDIVIHSTTSTKTIPLTPMSDGTETTDKEGEIEHNQELVPIGLLDVIEEDKKTQITPISVGIEATDGDGFVVVDDSVYDTPHSVNQSGQRSSFANIAINYNADDEGFDESGDTDLEEILEEAEQMLEKRVNDDGAVIVYSDEDDQNEGITANEDDEEKLEEILRQELNEDKRNTKDKRHRNKKKKDHVIDDKNRKKKKKVTDKKRKKEKKKLKVENKNKKGNGNKKYTKKKGKTSKEDMSEMVLHNDDKKTGNKDDNDDGDDKGLKLEKTAINDDDQNKDINVDADDEENEDKTKDGTEKSKDKKHRKKVRNKKKKERKMTLQPIKKNIKPTKNRSKSMVNRSDIKKDKTKEINVDDKEKKKKVKNKKRNENKKSKKKGKTLKKDMNEDQERNENKVENEERITDVYINDNKTRGNKDKKKSKDHNKNEKTNPYRKKKQKKTSENV